MHCTGHEHRLRRNGDKYWSFRLLKDCGLHTSGLTSRFDAVEMCSFLYLFSLRAAYNRLLLFHWRLGKKSAYERVFEDSLI